MLSVGEIFQIENGFLLSLNGDVTIYCKDHKEVADVLISKRVAEKLREYQPQQLELDLKTIQDIAKP